MEKYDKGSPMQILQVLKDHLTSWLSKNVLKRPFLESGLTNSLTVCNFGNTLGMTKFFSQKIFEIWCRFHKLNKKFREKFFFLR